MTPELRADMLEILARHAYDPNRYGCTQGDHGANTDAQHREHIVDLMAETLAHHNPEAAE